MRRAILIASGRTPGHHTEVLDGGFRALEHGEAFLYVEQPALMFLARVAPQGALSIFQLSM
jgi:hypothetical protein